MFLNLNTMFQVFINNRKEEIYINQFIIFLGGLTMLQDISEYKKCSKKFRSSTVEQLFSILHALVNLLVVVPDNLRQVITEGHLV